MPNSFLKQLTTLALCGIIFVSALIGLQVNVLAQDSLDPDYAGAKCPKGQIRINNKCFCDPNKPTFKSCIKKQLKDKKQNFINAVLESTGDNFIPGGLLVHTVKDGQIDYLDAKLSLAKPVIFVGQDNNLIVEGIKFKDGEGQLVAASLIQSRATILTPSGRKITLKVVADMTGSYNINLSPKLKGLIQQSAFINPFGAIEAQAAESVQYTLENGDLRDLEQIGSYSTSISLINGGREISSRTASWKVTQDPGLIATVVTTVTNIAKPVSNIVKPVVDVLSRTGVNSSMLLAGLAIIVTAAMTYSVVGRREA